MSKIKGDHLFSEWLDTPPKFRLPNGKEIELQAKPIRAEWAEGLDCTKAECDHEKECFGT